MGSVPYSCSWRQWSKATSNGIPSRPLPNLLKHGVTFSEAATVFADPLAVYLDDGSGIGRMVVIGTSLRERVLFVVHVERGERDRVISARRATSGERDVYETGGYL
jgi:uncharacterized DUF497 family protein